MGFTDGPLFLYNLSLADKRGLLIPKVYLMLQAVRLIDDRLDDGIDDFAPVHADADFVADFGHHHSFTICCSVTVADWSFLKSI